MAQQDIALPVQHRAATVLPDTINEENHTVDVVWSTGAEVRRYDWARDAFFYEELEVSEKAIRMERMNNFASVLDSHHSWSLESVLGVVQRAWIEKGEARATLLIDTTTDEGEKNWKRIVGGFIRHISVGYAVHEFIERREAEKRILRATDWEPLEVSFVPIGADAGAGVRSQDQKTVLPCKVMRIGDEMAENEGGTQPSNDSGAQTDEGTRSAPAAPADNPPAATTEPTDAQRSAGDNTAEILEICELAGADARTARDFVSRGISPQDVRTELVRRKSQENADAISGNHTPGSSERQPSKLDVTDIYQRFNNQEVKHG